MNILETYPISIIRRNHGIEHATVHVLSDMNPEIRLVGRADTEGFNIYGDVDTQQLEQAAQTALKRLQGGEGYLAVHPRCGTQIVVGGLLAGVAAVAAMGRRPRLSKVPEVILATTIAAFLSPQLGLVVQEKFTTSPDAAGARFARIRQSQFGNIKTQHVDIEWDR